VRECAAARIAVTYRTPVILLSDTFLANSSEPWLLPSVDELPEIDPALTVLPNADGEFLAYVRDERLSSLVSQDNERGPA